MSHTSLQSNKTVIFSLYLIYFLDLASLVFVYVVLSDMIIDPASIFLAKTVSAQSRNLLIGILLGIYPLALFFAAPILGDLSDRFGRKPILLISILGTVVGSSLSAISIHLDSLFLLLISRFIAGAFAGNMTITQASISELAPYDKRERYMAAFAAIGGLAWTLGPFIAAFLSNSSLFPFLTYATPFWFLAILFFIALFLIIKSFKFEASQVEKEKIEFLKTFSRLMEIFKYPNVATPFLASLIAMFGWMMYQGFLGSYLIEKLQFNEQFEGYAYAFSSLFWFFGGALAQLSILKHYRAKKALILPLFLSGLAILAFLIIFQKPLVWPLFALANMAFAIAFSCFMGIFSGLVPHQFQGKLFGAWNAGFAICSGLGVFLSGFLAGFHINLPYIVAGLILISSALYYTFWSRKHHDV